MAMIMKAGKWQIFPHTERPDKNALPDFRIRANCEVVVVIVALLLPCYSHKTVCNFVSHHT